MRVFQCIACSSALGVAAMLLAARADSPAAAEPTGELETGQAALAWQPLFRGEGLAGWREVAFDKGGKVHRSNGVLSLGRGSPFTGVVCTNAVPRIDYEIELEARRDQGSDFFCGLTVPVSNAYCSLIVGGWGGGMVGISSIDEMDASENETSQYLRFDNGRWYRIRFRVTRDHLRVWLDGERTVNADIRDRRISLRRGDIERCTPLGLAAWDTAASIRKARIRSIPDAERNP